MQAHEHERMDHGSMARHRAHMPDVPVFRMPRPHVLRDVHMDACRCDLCTTRTARPSTLGRLAKRLWRGPTTGAGTAMTIRMAGCKLCE
jgi:hypothetical protein